MSVLTGRGGQSSQPHPSRAYHTHQGAAELSFPGNCPLCRKKSEGGLGPETQSRRDPPAGLRAVLAEGEALLGSGKWKCTWWQAEFGGGNLIHSDLLKHLSLNLQHPQDKTQMPHLV